MSYSSAAVTEHMTNSNVRESLFYPMAPVGQILMMAGKAWQQQDQEAERSPFYPQTGSTSSELDKACPGDGFPPRLQPLKAI